MRIRSIFAVLISTLTPVLPVSVALADDYHTPLAGEAFETDLWGYHVKAPARDRRRVSAISLGVQWVPNGPSSPAIIPFGGALILRGQNAEGGNLVQPFGAVYLWRNLEDGKKRFRGAISGLYNNIRFNITPKFLHGAEAVFTFDNFTVPFARPEYVEGQRVNAVDLEWNYVRAGLGIGYRAPLAPWHQDNALEIALTYEPGYLWFARDSSTARNFISPSDTYEGRVHFRLRADALERNLLELPHRGFTAGADLFYGHRNRWQTWGGSAFGIADAARQQDYYAASFYAVAAGGIPYIPSERHRLIASVYGGIGKDLDRFSAFRLGGRPAAWEWDAVSIPDLPGAAFYEFYSRSYGIIELRYRYEALFFLYPYLRGSLAYVDRPRYKDTGRVGNKMDMLPAVGAGFTMGAPWRSEVEFGYVYNFGLIRNPNGQPEFGGHGIMLQWSKEF